MMELRLLLLASALLSRQCHGFANNLVVTTVGCMTELDTSEVIMNNVVKAVEDSDFPKMHLVVVDEGDNHIESPYHYKNSELVVAFINPYTKEEFNDDLQFVMELLNEADAEFIDGGSIGCDGNRRVAARIQDYDGRATIKIHDTTKNIEILAGWATGQNSVRLTPKLVLEPKVEPAEPKIAEIKTEDENAGIHKEELPEIDTEKKSTGVKGEFHEVKNGKILEVPDDIVTPKSASAKKKSKREDVANENMAEQRKMAHMKQKDTATRKEKENQDKLSTKGETEHVDKIKITNKKDFIDAAKKRHKAKIAAESVASEETDDKQDESSGDSEGLKPINHRNSILKPHNDRNAEETRRKQLAEQMQKNFPQHIDCADRLHMGSYFFACAFFLFSIGSIVLVFGRKKEKGRRDL